MSTEPKEAKRAYSKIFRKIRNTVSGTSSSNLDGKEKPKPPSSPKMHRKEQSDQLVPTTINNSQSRMVDIDGKDIEKNSIQSNTDSLNGKSKLKDVPNRPRSETTGSSSAMNEENQFRSKLAPSFSIKSGLGEIGDDAGSIGNISAVGTPDSTSVFHQLTNTLKVVLLIVFSCALEKDILWQGRIYVTPTAICFYSKIFRNELKQIILFKDIKLIEKAVAVVIFPNAIRIHTQDAKYFFASFMKRDFVFDLLNDHWKKVLARCDESNSDDKLTEGSMSETKSGRNSLVSIITATPKIKLMQIGVVLMIILSGLVWFISGPKNSPSKPK